MTTSISTARATPAGSALASPLPPSLRHRVTQGVGPGSLSSIAHLVMLNVLEPCVAAPASPGMSLPTALAREFTVCNNYYAPVSSSTLPARLLAEQLARHDIHCRDYRPAQQGLTNFVADCARDRLPAFSFIQVEEAPGSADDPVLRILDAIASNAAIWARTALVITCDAVSRAHAAAPARSVSGELYGLSTRVSAMVVSPWSRGGIVCSEALDPGSIVRFAHAWALARSGRPVPAEGSESPGHALSGDFARAFDFRARPAASPAQASRRAALLP